VTVLLPAIIIHLLNIKSCNDEARKEAMAGFCKCMTVLEILRDNYASADFAVSFLDAAIKKADIDVKDMPYTRERTRQHDQGGLKPQDLIEKARTNRYTPPPSGEEVVPTTEEFDFGTTEQDTRPENDNTVLTPPESDGTLSAEQERQAFDDLPTGDMDPGKELNMAEFFDFPETGNEMWNVPLEEGAHGESGGFMGDMNWLDFNQWGSRLNSPEPGDMFDDVNKPLEVEVSA
jgi:hypothetical protein